METIEKVKAVLESAECLYSFSELNEALDRPAVGQKVIRLDEQNVPIPAE